MLNTAHVVNGDTYGVRDGGVIRFAASKKSKRSKTNGNYNCDLNYIPLTKVGCEYVFKIFLGILIVMD